MENALLVGLSRQMALTHELDIVANNIANINTTGYKADNTLFAQYLMPRASDQSFTGRDRRVDFVQDRAQLDRHEPRRDRAHRQSARRRHRRATPILVVQTPRGQQRYTRNGALSINATGQLVTSDGDQVVGNAGPITFQPSDHDISHQRQRHHHRARRQQHRRHAARHAATRHLRLSRSVCRRTAAQHSRRRPASTPIRRRPTPAWCKARSRNRTSTASPKWRA